MYPPQRAAADASDVGASSSTGSVDTSSERGEWQLPARLLCLARLRPHPPSCGWTTDEEQRAGAPLADQGAGGRDRRAPPPARPEGHGGRAAQGLVPVREEIRTLKDAVMFPDTKPDRHVRDEISTFTWQIQCLDAELAQV